MLILQSRPNEAVITFTVHNFVSVRQGMMLTADPPKDVSFDVTLNTGSKALAISNGELVFTVGNEPPVQLTFVVAPKDEYAAVDLFVQKLTTGNDGGAWDNLHVGNGQHDYTVEVRNKGRPSTSPLEFKYHVYMLIRRRQANAGENYPLGDIGVIDPVWINR